MKTEMGGGAHVGLVPQQLIPNHLPYLLGTTVVYFSPGARLVPEIGSSIRISNGGPSRGLHLVQRSCLSLQGKRSSLTVRSGLLYSRVTAAFYAMLWFKVI